MATFKTQHIREERWREYARQGHATDQLQNQLLDGKSGVPGKVILLYASNITTIGTLAKYKLGTLESALGHRPRKMCLFQIQPSQITISINFNRLN